MENKYKETPIFVDDKDDSVLVTHVKWPSSQLVDKAISLGLPETFYNFENQDTDVECVYIDGQEQGNGNKLNGVTIKMNKKYIDIKPIKHMGCVCTPMAVYCYATICCTGG